MSTCSSDEPPGRRLRRLPETIVVAIGLAVGGFWLEASETV